MPDFGIAYGVTVYVQKDGKRVRHRWSRIFDMKEKAEALDELEKFKREYSDPKYDVRLVVRQPDGQWEPKTPDEI